MTGHRIDVEFGLTIREVSPADLGPILESLTRLTKNGVVHMTPETQRALQAHAPLALASAGLARRRGRPSTLTRAAVIAALTAWQGSVPEAAKALGKSAAGVYKFCQKHQIMPAAFRPPKEARR